MGKRTIAYRHGEIGKVEVVKDFLPPPEMLVPAVFFEIYELPAFLINRVTPSFYRRWLQRKAAAHCRRDRKRHTDREIVLSSYKRQIHEAVCASNGLDWYTGELLCWEKISTYDNEASKVGRSTYKAEYALLPTVDHVRKESGYEFVICGWRTNDAKNDLSLEHFVALCQRVIERHG